MRNIRVAGNYIRWPVLINKYCLVFSLTRFILYCPSSFLCYEIMVYFYSRLGKPSGILSVKSDPTCADKYLPLFEQFFFSPVIWKCLTLSYSSCDSFGM